jgi:hypothetical protein
MSMRMSVSMALIITMATLVAVNAQQTGTNPQAGEQAQPGSGSSSEMLPSELAAKQRLEEAGYTNVRNVHSGPEALTAKATKDGKEVDIAIDSFGKIIARPAQ